MPGWVRFWGWVIVALVVCYALNIDPLGVLGGVIHGLKAAHQASATGH